MKYLRSLSTTTRILLLATAAFLLYGYLCRLLDIYFFWESKSIGWALFFAALISLLRDRIKSKRPLGKRALLEKIGVGFSIFALVVKGIFFFAVPHTDAYEKAVNIIGKDPRIQQEVGTVNGVSLIPAGNFTMKSNAEGSSGEAYLSFVVKGSRKYIDLGVLLEKTAETEWEMVGVGM